MLGGGGGSEDSAITQEHMLKLLKADETGVTADEICQRSAQFRRLPTEAETRAAEARKRAQPASATGAKPDDPAGGGPTPKPGA
jgi:ParB-like chromosome segregation protein Spo0J